ncbi:wings apart-like protein 1 [Corylus avellana]|uniref:wings apart-like protein 1 n=1 Tax=Corylus avellana TaxID=13451 RepID=UPI00286B8694|nr:wings apart-like protein 1 [Corylus avellana]
MSDTCSLKIRVSSSTSGSRGGTSRGSNSGTFVTDNGSSKQFGPGKRPSFLEDAKIELLENSQDPFAFDEDEFEPSKWDLLSGKQKPSRSRKIGVTYRELEDGCQSQFLMSQQESSNDGKNHGHELSRPNAVDEEGSRLLADCLLTAVKVLMNLTNDNPVGCQQIAGCGGLETMSSLIAAHFPSFSSSSSPSSEIKEKSSSIDLDHQNDRHLSDQELDFLVAILGLLVNLVEKDGRNRSRLAAATVPLPGLEGFEEESQRDVIPLMCSIFLANRGAGEGAGEGEDMPLNDEAALLQGEKEAEKMIVEAYSALLLAFLSTESKSVRDAIADCLPNHNLSILVPVLERFVAFHLTLNMISPETHTAVSEVIESCRVP